MGTCVYACRKVEDKHEFNSNLDMVTLIILDENKESFTIQISREKTILDLKIMISQAKKLSILNFKLLEDSEELPNYGVINQIKNREEINLVLIKHKESKLEEGKLSFKTEGYIYLDKYSEDLNKSMELIEMQIRTMKGETFSISKHKNILISNLLEEISSKIKVPKENILISFKGNQLASTRRLFQYSVPKNCTLFVVDLSPENKSTFQINYENQVHQISIANSCDIELLKDKIAEKYKLNIDSFDLSYNGVLLNKLLRVGTIELVENGKLEIKLHNK